MKLNPVQLQLDPEHVQEILRIALDDDAERALDFVKTVLFRRIDKALQRR